MGADFVDYFLVALLGAATGCGELMTRYRDAPLRSLKNMSATAYVALNALAGIVGLALLRVFNVDFGLTDSNQLRWTQILVGGLAAMALFRTSLFIAHVGDEDIGMGPSGVLQSLLKVADRGVDRTRAKARAGEVAKAMQSVSFDKAQGPLPPYCFALMQNVTTEEQEAVAQNIVGKLRASTNMSDSTKALALGLALMNIVGDGVLLAAVRSLGDEIKGLP